MRCVTWPLLACVATAALTAVAAVQLDADGQQQQSSCDTRWLSLLQAPATRGSLLLSTAQAAAVSAALGTLRAARQSPSLLVMGVGSDSPVWAALNCGGRTAFVENDEAWLARMRAAHPSLELHGAVWSPTNSSDSTGGSSAPLRPPALPPGIADTCWDVIIIDNPAGYDPGHGFPGRAQAAAATVSATAACLERGALPAAQIFLHDAQRTSEAGVVTSLLASEAGLVMPLGMLPAGVTGGGAALAGFLLGGVNTAATTGSVLCGRWLDGLAAHHARDELARAGFPGNTMTAAQAVAIAGALTGVATRLRRPASMLVFASVTSKVQQWADAGCGGRMLLLTHDEADTAAPANGSATATDGPISVSKVSYRSGPALQLDGFLELPMMPELPPAAQEGCWDVLLVDGPSRAAMPPAWRTEALYAAVQLAISCVNSGALQTATLFLHADSSDEAHAMVSAILMPHQMVEPLGVLTGRDGVGLAGFLISQHAMRSAWQRQLDEQEQQQLEKQQQQQQQRLEQQQQQLEQQLEQQQQQEQQTVLHLQQPVQPTLQQEQQEQQPMRGEELLHLQLSAEAAEHGDDAAHHAVHEAAKAPPLADTEQHASVLLQVAAEQLERTRIRRGGNWASASWSSGTVPPITSAAGGAGVGDPAAGQAAASTGVLLLRTHQPALLGAALFLPLGFLAGLLARGGRLGLGGVGRGRLGSQQQQLYAPLKG